MSDGIHPPDLDPALAPAILDPAEIAKVQAEILVDRTMLSILRSLRDDPTADSLRSLLLGHVMAGSGTVAALLLLGNGAPSHGILERIEAKIDAIAARPVPARAAGERGAGSPSPRMRAKPGEGRAAGQAQAIPVPEAEDTAAPALARIVAAGLSRGRTVPPPPAAEEDAPPAANPVPEDPVPATATSRPRSAPVARGGPLSHEVRTFVSDLAARMGHPVTPEEVMEEAPAALQKRIVDEYGARYVHDILKRSCIRIGRNLYWPLGRPLPDGMGMPWDEVEASGITVRLPEGNQDRAAEADGIVRAYNDAAPDGRRLRFEKGRADRPARRTRT